MRSLVRSRSRYGAPGTSNGSSAVPRIQHEVHRVHRVAAELPRVLEPQAEQAAHGDLERERGHLITGGQRAGARPPLDAARRQRDDLRGVSGEALLGEPGQEDPALTLVVLAVLPEDVPLQRRGRAVRGHLHHQLDEVGEQRRIAEHAVVELRAEYTQPARIVARERRDLAILLVELEHPRDRIGEEAEHVELAADDGQRARTRDRDPREVEEHRHGRAP